MAESLRSANVNANNKVVVNDDPDEPGPAQGDTARGPSESQSNPLNGQDTVQHHQACQESGNIADLDSTKNKSRPNQASASNDGDTRAESKLNKVLPL